MKKRLFFIVAILVLSTVVLAGCLPFMIDDIDIPFIGRINGNSNNSGNQQGTQDSIKDTTVVINSVESNINNPLVDIIDSVHSSVVEINAINANGKSSAGSGVIVSVSQHNSYVITCQHVVEDAKDIKVILTNDEVFSAIYMGGVFDQDIAVLKFAKTTGINSSDTRNLTKSPIKIGENVIAIGNPLGSLGGSVTKGIISSLSREINVEGTVMSLIQTDASINSGNSGGGLFDENGYLIGIVNAKATGTNVEGLGFAIPIDTALSIAENIINTSNAIDNPYNDLGYIPGKFMLGITVYTEETTAGRFRYVIESVDKYGSMGGVLAKGDRIISIDNKNFSASVTLQSILAKKKIGDTLTVSVEKKSNNSYTQKTYEVVLKQYVYGYTHP